MDRSSAPFGSSSLAPLLRAHRRCAVPALVSLCLSCPPTPVREKLVKVTVPVSVPAQPSLPFRPYTDKGQHCPVFNFLNHPTTQTRFSSCAHHPHTRIHPVEQEVS